jgi:uncharacterized protein
MDSIRSRFESVLIGVFIMIVIIVAVYFSPWENVTWGRLKLLAGDTITVVGEAKTKQLTQKATFSAGVNAVNDNKDQAIKDVNNKIDTIITALKTFGIKSEDIKTQNLSVYQSEETYYEDGRQKSRPGQWRVGNTVEITLNDVSRAQDLANVLTGTGANNINGPNFSIDDTSGTETNLLTEAITSAQKKAFNMATATGRKLGKVVNIVEGYSAQPVQLYGGAGIGGGGGGGMEPGTGTVTKTVTVTYQLVN